MSDKIEEIRARHELVGSSGSVIHPTGFNWTIPGWVAHADRATLLAEVERLRADNERLRKALQDIAEDCDDDYPPSHGAIKYAVQDALRDKP